MVDDLPDSSQFDDKLHRFKARVMPSEKIYQQNTSVSYRLEGLVGGVSHVIFHSTTTSHQRLTGPVR